MKLKNCRLFLYHFLLQHEVHVDDVVVPLQNVEKQWRGDVRKDDGPGNNQDGSPIDCLGN